MPELSENGSEIAFLLNILLLGAGLLKSRLGELSSKDALASSEDSDEPVHPHSLARDFAAGTETRIFKI